MLILLRVNSVLPVYCHKKNDAFGEEEGIKTPRHNMYNQRRKREKAKTISCCTLCFYVWLKSKCVYPATTVCVSSMSFWPCKSASGSSGLVEGCKSTVPE